MGYLKGVIHGTIIGTVVGLCVAPQEGARTRAQLQGTVNTVRDGITRAQATARRMAPTVQTAAQQVGDVVGQVKDRVAGDHAVAAATNGSAHESAYSNR